MSISGHGVRKWTYEPLQEWRQGAGVCRKPGVNVRLGRIRKLEVRVHSVRGDGQ